MIRTVSASPHAASCRMMITPPPVVRAGWRRGRLGRAAVGEVHERRLLAGDVAGRRLHDLDGRAGRLAGGSLDESSADGGKGAGSGAVDADDHSAGAVAAAAR